MRKMDEMEMSIALQSMRWSWGFGLISLAIYNIYLLATTGQTGLSFIIMFTMLIIYRVVYLYKIQKTNDNTSFWRDAMIIVILIFLLVGLLLFFGLNNGK